MAWRLRALVSLTEYLGLAPITLEFQNCPKLQLQSLYGLCGHCTHRHYARLCSKGWEVKTRLEIQGQPYKATSRPV